MLTVRIETENAAFEDHTGTELARILRDLADKCETGWLCMGAGGNTPLRDSNGNTVGVASFTPSHPSPCQKGESE